MTYPPEPWHLRGDLHLSVWLVRKADWVLPPGTSAVRVGPWHLVGTAWVDYQEGSVLTYREVMSTLLVRAGWRVLPTVTHIWVDSPESRDGGRALWGIPKGLARFTVDGERWDAVQVDGVAVGSARVRVGRGLPWRVPVRFSVAQELRGALKVSPVRSRARVHVSRVEWGAAAEGPLGFLAGRRPVVSLSLRGFEMSFGG
ncbi:acetoacetate decarboxylase family protein [Actinokineospora bangkokensis]|uniref:Acetoacetate decarboxylase n=1 Tax=Actinokineospora bangkokensis TaxID=1193682 RepID=A0A1Q9LJC3_9PSEU|nr:acetoacetate decarboxylase family protein [Actinokineospora bangkokensis]OLR92079.1 hypothetical protein BJP25_22250 [Actinokineospora bangkokensis]